VVGLDPDVDVQPCAAAGLREADGAELVEHLVRDVPDPLHGLPVALGSGIEVDTPLVGRLGVGAAAVPGMELDRGHLDRPDHARELGHAELVGGAVPSREVQPHRLQPRRRAGWDPLLVHLVAGQSLGEAVQHAGPLVERVDDPVPDREVVLHQVELGGPRLREVDTVGVAHPDDVRVHLDLDAG
jgi:hypothetical protein